MKERQAQPAMGKGTWNKDQQSPRLTEPYRTQFPAKAGRDHACDVANQGDPLETPCRGIWLRLIRLPATLQNLRFQES